MAKTYKPRLTYPNFGEDYVKAMVRRLLTEVGAWFFMPATGGFGKSGVPDFILCIAGKLVAIECKSPGKHATALQAEQIKQINAAGGYAIEFDGKPEVFEALRRDLIRLKNSHLPLDRMT